MTSDPRDFRKLQFKSPESFDRKWLEWYREEFGRRLFRIDMEISKEVPFRLENTSRILPDLAVSNLAFSPMRNRHSTDLIADDDLMMAVVQAGELSLHFDGQDMALAPGMVAIGRNDVAATLVNKSNAQILGIRLRRRLIEPLVRNFSDVRGLTLPTGSQAMQLLLGYLQMLDRQDALVTPEARQLVTTHVHDLVALALGATAEARAAAEIGSIPAARLAAIKSYILSNLQRPDLSVAGVAARHLVTPRYVYALLEAEGATFSGYVNAQRLARAHHMLNDPRFADHPINAVAFAVGFGDLSYFNRIFRRRYGATPSEVRARARREPER
jgi:AraC-like DNA-binding protein